jgi:ATP-GRASP peptide maturase of grasp-with-spasm system
MILILSKELDISTNEVMDWLLFYNQEIIRINTNIDESQIKINSSEIILSSNNIIIDFQKVKSFWYRKNGIQIKTNNKIKRKTKTNKIFRSFLHYETKILSSFLEWFLSKKSGIGYLEDPYINKLKILCEAKKCGLLIPETIITTKKNKLNPETKYIIKPISEGRKFKLFNRLRMMYTREVNLNQLTSTFNPTLFQTKIDKEYELRVFYLNGKCYSMAIFSQKDQKTKVDFRNYNIKKPNRNVPYLLPQEIKNKIHKLMTKLNMSTGSIDLIVDKNQNYYFLEVNPSGQFGMLSKPCNYPLEKEIAKELIKLSK